VRSALGFCSIRSDVIKDLLAKTTINNKYETFQIYD
jgi:hypothetical protein